MLDSRVCDRVRFSMGSLRFGIRDVVGVALVAGVAVRACARSAIGCGCTPLEVGTRTLGVCTSIVVGDIGVIGVGRALGRDVV